MFDASHSFDCAIVGGGPCGSLLAARLAEWGHKVALFDRGGPRGGLPEEFVGGDAEPLLRRHGLLSSVRAHGFRDLTARGLVWGDGELRWREDEEARGIRIRRDLFDADLRRMARGLGATVFEDTRVEGPLPESGRGAITVRAEDGDTAELLTRSIVVTTGRQPSAELLPVALRRQLARASALTVSVPLRHSREIFRDASVIEAVEEGWLWWLPRSDGAASLTLVADPECVKTAGARGIFDRALLGSSGPAAVARELDLDVEEVDFRGPYPGFGGLATARLVETPSRIVLAGDAASTIDPITTRGIEKALASAEQAAGAVNTILRRPDLASLAVEHHRDWEAARWEDEAQRAMRWYLGETRFADAPFWSARHESVRVEIDRVPSPSDFPTKLRPHPALQRRPALERRGHVLVETEGFALPESDRAIARLGRVPLLPVIEHLERNPDVDRFLEVASCDGRLYLLSRGHVLQALTDMVRLGMIVEAGEGERRG
ncbi:MAG: NAD(P)/FAD-dependent oxidoreductase [Planctomycetota bacterium]